MQQKTLAVALMALASLMPSVYGACCTENNNGVCNDGTEGTPCCGYRSCNIFCCACECRRSARRDGFMDVARATSDLSSTASTFEVANVASDGKLTLDEYLAWANTTGKNVKTSVWENYFKKFDADNKGYVTFAEAGAA